MENEIVHKVYLAIDEGPMQFPTFCGAVGGEESMDIRKTTCQDCLKEMKLTK